MLAGSYPWTRLIIYFRRDDMPNDRFGWWAPLWEMVAKFDFQVDSADRPDVRSNPSSLVFDFVETLFDELDSAVWDPSAVEVGGEESPFRVQRFFPRILGEIQEPPGVRWMRHPVGW